MAPRDLIVTTAILDPRPHAHAHAARTWSWSWSWSWHTRAHDLTSSCPTLSDQKPRSFKSTDATTTHAHTLQGAAAHPSIHSLTHCTALIMHDRWMDGWDEMDIDVLLFSPYAWDDLIDGIS